MLLTNHAESRSRDRGISEGMIEVVLRFGSTEYHRGAQIVALDKKGLRRAMHYLGSLYSGSPTSLQQVYVVKDGDTILTVARRNRHLKRNRH